jgi:16S rRNA (cytosine967-C5)-methyltransferase
MSNPKPSPEGGPKRPFWAAVYPPRRRAAPPPGPATGGGRDREEGYDRQERPAAPSQPRVAPEKPARPDRSEPRSPANWAARIVARSNRERPADGELRETLRRVEDLRPGDARWISRAVFAYFRWQEWLDLARPLEQRLDQAMGFADTYAHQPQRFPDDDLAGGAVPAWVSTVMEVPTGWVRSLQREPRLWIRARPGTGEAVAEQLGGGDLVRPGALPDSLEYTGWEDLFRTKEFHAGAFEIQDPASQAVGWCCAPSPGQRWWDLCAGEGGKTLHLADLLKVKGLVYATDRAAWRLERLRERAQRAQVFNWQAATWDETKPIPTPGSFDGVLVDAPCSGLGTWGRNPHARWTTTVQDVEELAVVQAKLLARAAAAVKPGGRLVYSVCTLTRPETSGVCDAFEASHPGFVPERVPDPFGKRPAAARHLFWPQDTGGNGMFVAVWKRLGKAPPEVRPPAASVETSPESAPTPTQPETGVATAEGQGQD